MVYLRDFLNSNKDFFKDNFILFASNFMLGVFGYLYQFYLGRALGPGDYGIVGVLFAIAYIEGVSFNTILATTTKFTANLKARNEISRINALFFSLLKYALILGIVIFLMFLIFSKSISYFLNINDAVPIILVGLFFIIAVLIPVNRGILQGLQHFKMLGANLIFEGITKIVFVIILVKLGFGVNGAMIALILSYLIPFSISYFQVKKLVGNNKEDVDIKPLIRYSVPVLLSLFSLTLIFTLDVILVKHLLDPIKAGHYSALSLLGKVIFFASTSIAMVMFAKVSDHYESKKPTRPLFYKSLLLVLAIAVPITLFYFLFPYFTINLLFGREYYDIANIIGLFAMFMTIFSLLWITLFYNLSINRNWLVSIILIFDAIEVVMIYLYHSTLLQVVVVLLTLALVLFFILLSITILSKNESVNNNPSI